jgi:Ca-activated chloride channel family protein
MRSWLALLLLSSLIGFAPPQDPAGKARKANPNPGDRAQAPAPEQETISVETNLVVVNVTVTDARERYIAGLKAEEFRVFEDRAPQRITSFAFEEMPFAAVILLDTSGSMEAKMSLARAACSRFAGGIREGDSVAIYSFGGTKVRMLQDFTELRDVADAVWDLRADGDTPLYDGIVKAAEELGRRPERRRAILLVSDGADTRSRATLDDALRKVAVANVAVYAVDLSDAALYRTARRDSGADVLKDLAAKSGGRFYRTPGGSQLRDAFVATVEELRSQYTLTYEPSNERRDGRWRTVDVRVNRPALNVRARQGYHAPKARQ